jgi:hypothetical protein
MHENAYEIARQHAASEIAEINAQIEKLTHRKKLINQLLELYTQLSPLPESNDGSVGVLDAAIAAEPATEVGKRQLPELEAVPQ